MVLQVLLLSTYPYPLTTVTYYKSSTTQHNASAYHSTFPTVGSISLIRLRFLFEITVPFKTVTCIESFTKRTDSAYTTESSPVLHLLLKLDTIQLRRYNPHRTFCLHRNCLHEMYPPLFHRLANKKPMLCLFFRRRYPCTHYVPNPPRPTASLPLPFYRAVFVLWSQISLNVVFPHLS